MKTESFTEFILPESYIQFSPVSAEITMAQHGRLMGLDGNFLRSLHDHLIAKFGGQTTRALYDIGYQWGVGLYQDLEQLALKLHPEASSIKELSMEQFHRLFTNHLASIGWGNFELKRRDDFLFVDLYHSLYAEVIPRADSAEKVHTLCHVYAGFFAGIFSQMSNMELACSEVTCTCDGYENCSFILDSRETIAAIAQRVRGQVTPLEAFQQVKKEYEGA